ncbi:MAG: hypothetical protein AAGE98_13650 [Actinomycetota bacterium]
MNEPVPVQPREIVDVVYRIVRVGGLDHGDADLMARWVACEEIAGRSRLDEVLGDPAELLEHARAADRHGEADPFAVAGYHDAARHGLPVASGRFRELYEAAKAFLVAEATLDEIDG